MEERAMAKRSEPDLESDCERVALTSGVVGNLKLVEIRGSVLLACVAALVPRGSLEHAVGRGTESGNRAVDGFFQRGAAPGRSRRLGQQRGIPESPLRAPELEANPGEAVGRRDGRLDGELRDDGATAGRGREGAASRNEHGRHEENEDLPNLGSKHGRADAQYPFSLSMRARSGSPVRMRRRFSMNVSITRPARRGEPPAVWGVTITRGWVQSRWPLGRGSGSVTSRPAPHRSPSSRAARRSSP